MLRCPRTADADCSVRSRAWFSAEPAMSRADAWLAVEFALDTPPAAPKTTGPMNPPIAPPDADVLASECASIRSCSDERTMSAMSRSWSRSAANCSVSVRDSVRVTASRRSQSSSDTSFCCPGASAIE